MLGTKQVSVAIGGVTFKIIDGATVFCLTTSGSAAWQLFIGSFTIKVHVPCVLTTEQDCAVKAVVGEGTAVPEPGGRNKKLTGPGETTLTMQSVV
jgi:hypothetical protein